MHFAKAYVLLCF